MNKGAIELSMAMAIISCLIQDAMGLSSLVHVSKENYRLEGHVIKTQTTQGIMQCAHQCLAMPTCGGYNYKKTAVDNGPCESVGSLETTEDSFKLVDGQGWVSGKLKSEDTLFLFTHLNAHGREGPTSINKYEGTSLEGKVQLDKGIQTWIAPETGSYVIEAWGASGGNGLKLNNSVPIWRKGGLGARIKKTFFLNRGQHLKVLVGQEGQTLMTFSHHPGSGGGGTFVTLSDNTPLVAAGGGGGGAAPNPGWKDGGDGQASENGTSSGGYGGLGGRLVSSQGEANLGCGAGGGFTSDGESHFLAKGGTSFIKGGQGGDHSPAKEGNGGFGGGGSCNADPGGGGGYSGGGVTRTKEYTLAGGGGSFNGGTDKDSESGTNKGNGRVLINILP